MGFSAFIGDGYDEERFIDEVPRLYPAARITIRPMTATDVSVFLQRTRTADETTSRVEVAKEISRRIVSWDVVKADGAPLEATPENLQRLRSAFFKRLEAIVFGWDPGDAERREADLKN